MKANQPRARMALLALGLLPLAATAGPADPVDEIIVRGTPAELVIDAASLRIDIKEHARLMALGVRDALKQAEARVASANTRERG
jgi:hypothetical protein